MCTFRDVVIFVAGAEFFHTLTHIILPHIVKLPIDMHYVVLTSKANYWAIGINAAITIVLLIWASKIKSAKRKK